MAWRFRRSFGFEPGSTIVRVSSDGGLRGFGRGEEHSAGGDVASRRAELDSDKLDKAAPVRDALLDLANSGGHMPAEPTEPSPRSRPMLGMSLVAAIAAVLLLFATLGYEGTDMDAPAATSEVPTVSVDRSYGETLVAGDILANADCDGGRPKAAQVLDGWKAAGVVDEVGLHSAGVSVDVFTSRWNTAGQAAQRSIGFAAYCLAVGDDGRGVAMVVGSLGERLSALVDGKFVGP